jgi:AcrR family transcriptional regulator
MAPQSISGKGPRTYRSELRRQQAEQTRSRIVAAAAELFAAEGYARTTLPKIAAAAGVSAETVQGQGPKAALLIAAAEFAAFGVIGEVDILNLDIGRKVVTIVDREAAVDYLVAAATEVHERTAHLASAVTVGAASDPTLERYLNDFIAGINAQHRRILEVYRDRGWLRDDVGFDELVMSSAVLFGVEPYLRITHRGGWSGAAYRAWVKRMFVETILN